MNAITRLLLATVLMAIPGAAAAHTQGSGGLGLAEGFMHPLGGLDHVLAMVTVGVLAALGGGVARWLVPVTFMAFMASAAGIGMAGFELPFVELGIGVSVVLLGVAVALRFETPTVLAAALAGLFAVFHGHAHGAEMPAAASALSYGLGFVAATGILHVVGIAAGSLVAAVGQRYGRPATQVAGAAVALFGLASLGSAP